MTQLFSSKVVSPIRLSERQELIIEIVKKQGPITGEQIAEQLNLTRATLRPDLAILTMAGFVEARPRVGYFIGKNSNVRLYAAQLENQLVKDYKAHPIVINESASVYDAIVQLFLEDVGTLFVLNKEGQLAGVISRKDLLRAAIGNKSLEELPVSIIMTRMPNIVTIFPEETLLDAAKKLINNAIDSLPVVRRVGQGENTYEVMGRITKTTITRAYVELLDDESI
ncbi:helix-turn-helix transcriptional regulator [Rubeoparvulum massiliense]|uniref:helix-turn-helix transcriptional regulator n=1 Tax=Rubeoparvulum massiliense TaxID=1631346 RepID=UPI00065DE4ED|nr:helix-turn-helix transcriptional regulator [Rubeoparvulum massiliense]